MIVALGLGSLGLLGVLGEAHTKQEHGNSNSNSNSNSTSNSNVSANTANAVALLGEEASVHYILGKMYAPDDFGNVGLPAFNQQQVRADPY